MEESNWLIGGIVLLVVIAMLIHGKVMSDVGAKPFDPKPIEDDHFPGMGSMDSDDGMTTKTSSLRDQMMGTGIFHDK